MKKTKWFGFYSITQLLGFTSIQLCAVLKTLTHIALTQKSCVGEIFITVLVRSSPAHQETLVKLYTLNPSQKKKHVKTGELPLSVVLVNYIMPISMS